MKNLEYTLIKLAQEESLQEFPLKEPLVWDSKRFEVTRYNDYMPMCDPDRFFKEEQGYFMTDGCSTEFYIDDRVRCSIFYDRLTIINEGHTVESFDDPLRFLRKIANQKFVEIWDDEDEQKNIDMVKRMAMIIAKKIEEDDLLDNES
ncbi:MAG: hypothetical protein ACNI3C_04115 [Candidatus Marinarcus sp.]|uniref:hypothetical protein n=1 Tax=Candidatus Marinarcus sp. TaxID=3100987 RepID=UPI003B00BE46